MHCPLNQYPNALPARAGIAPTKKNNTNAIVHHLRSSARETTDVDKMEGSYIAATAPNASGEIAAATDGAVSSCARERQTSPTPTPTTKGVANSRRNMATN